MIRRVMIDALAPTGEGIARSADGVGFVAGALPGEEVEAEVGQRHKRFWKGRAVEIRRSAPQRRTGGHADGCAGCDWAHVDLASAREWKRALFLETMERIGRLPRELFGELPIAPSLPGYRIRSRFHVSGSAETTAVGFFAPRTHRVEDAQWCDSLGSETRELLPRLRRALAGSLVRVSEIAIAETLDGSHRVALATLEGGADRRDADVLLASLADLFRGVAVAGASGAIVAAAGQRRLWLPVGGREFPLSAGIFFQGNRHLLGALYGDVAREAAAVPAGRALDAFGGVGLFAGALLDAGHAVESVESDGAAVDLALDARSRWGSGSWTITRSAVAPFLAAENGGFDLAVVDPPRAGLGLELDRALPSRVARLLIYVSCDPATLARDLAALTAVGFQIRGARLYDLFAFTHRVEAAVTLERAAVR